MTTCEVADSVQAFKCQTEEQCDDCFIIDHHKECDWCEHYDHTIRRLSVAHQPSALILPTPPALMSFSHTFAGKTGVLSG
jgi:hypothetical protein